MPQFKAGRDKPVPYDARSEVVHEFGTGRCAGGRPGPSNVVHEFKTDGVGAALVAARFGVEHAFDSGRDNPVPYNRFGQSGEGTG